MRDPLTSSVDIADDADQFPRRHVLEHVSASARRECALNLDVTVECGQHHHSSFWILSANVYQRVDAANVREPKIHESDIRAKHSEKLDALAAARRLADHVQI